MSRDMDLIDGVKNSKVVAFPDVGRAPDVSVAPVEIVVKALHVSKRRMTRSFFEQISIVMLTIENFPPRERIFGWVMGKHEVPWLLFKDGDGRLARWQFEGWTYGGVPMIRAFEQLFLV